MQRALFVVHVIYPINGRKRWPAEGMKLLFQNFAKKLFKCVLDAKTLLAKAFQERAYIEFSRIKQPNLHSVVSVLWWVCWGECVVVSVVSERCACVSWFAYKPATMCLNKDMAKVFLWTQNIFVRMEYVFFFSENKWP